jgi:hypothetical protein
MSDSGIKTPDLRLFWPSEGVLGLYHPDIEFWDVGILVCDFYAVGNYLASFWRLDNSI